MNEYPTDYSTYSTAPPEMDPGLAMAILGGVALVLLITIASLWKIFSKAGKPGWAALVPIYNIIVFLQVIGRPVWWILFFFAGIIPVVGPIVLLVVAVITSHDLSKSFGKGVGYTLLQIFLPFIAYPMLAWGDARYIGPAAAGGHASTATPSAPTEPTPPATTPTPPAQAATPPTVVPPTTPTPPTV